MRLGLSLTEDTYFDERSGRIMNPSLAEYHLAVHLDLPGDRCDLERHSGSAQPPGRMASAKLV